MSAQKEQVEPKYALSVYPHVDLKVSYYNDSFSLSCHLQNEPLGHTQVKDSTRVKRGLEFGKTSTWVQEKKPSVRQKKRRHMGMEGQSSVIIFLGLINGA